MQSDDACLTSLLCSSYKPAFTAPLPVLRRELRRDPGGVRASAHPLKKQHLGAKSDEYA